ncbi:hypothetical protein QE152_g27087 [Popillia japonica]|uniref:Uncharacterized protein n=1 Tax=Popillia japonica TaxID=7064 RepID=A0AAW1JW32_POPJA
MADTPYLRGQGTMNPSFGITGAKRDLSDLLQSKESIFGFPFEITGLEYLDHSLFPPLSTTDVRGTENFDTFDADMVPNIY